MHSTEEIMLQIHTDSPEKALEEWKKRAETGPTRRSIGVLQPSNYQDFSESISKWAVLGNAFDFAVILDIDGAGQDPIPGVSATLISEQLTVPFLYLPQAKLAPRFLAKLIGKEDRVAFIGGGYVQQLPPLVELEWSRGEVRSVAVIYGGDSAEREVSLHSGRAVANALEEAGCQVQLLNISDLLLSGEGVAMLTGPHRPDAAFLAVHGNRAEDGAIQGLLELLHLPYTGSDIQSSAVAMDKNLTKQLLSLSGIRFPAGILIHELEEFDRAALPVGPWVVKPNAQGSTVGLSFVSEKSELRTAVERALRHGDSVLIEEQIVGTEISVPVLVDRALPAVEIVPASGRYDFASKYTPNATEELCPARISPEVEDRARAIALKAHQVLGCRGATRTDMIVRGDEVIALEINTLPGMTPTSLLPKSAQTAGISFVQLCMEILEDALAKTPA